MEQIGSQVIQLGVSDQSQLHKLRNFLATEAPKIRVQQVTGYASPGELGVPDILELLVSGVGGGGMLAAIRVLPEFLRSRRSSLEITTMVEGKQVILTATNIDEVMPILERLLGEQPAPPA